MRRWNILFVALLSVWSCGSVAYTKESEIQEARRISLHLCETYIPDRQFEYFERQGKTRHEACSGIIEELFPADGREHFVPDGTEKVSRLFGEDVRKNITLIQKWAEPKGKDTGFVLIVASLADACLSLADHDAAATVANGACILEDQQGLLPRFVPDLKIVNDIPARRSELESLFPVGRTSDQMMSDLTSRNFQCREIDNRQSCRAEAAVIGFHDGKLAAFGGIWWSVIWHANEKKLVDSVKADYGGAGL